MLKSLFATCLTALSVNTQPLAVSPSIEPSNAISEGTNFNVGDIYLLSYDYDFNNSLTINIFADEGDIGIDTLMLNSFNISNTYTFKFLGNLPFSFDYCEVTIASQPLNPDVGQYFPIFIIDNLDDEQITLDVYNSIFSSSPHIDISFEILEGFGGFSSEALPYLTKVDKPYTPPAKSNLYRLLYDFYYSIFNDDDLTAISTGYNMPFDNWLAHTCTIATLITLIVVAFFFLRWLFKVISGLILLKR